MNYKEAAEYLESLQRYGCVPGLDSIKRLCAKLGSPQDKLKFVHIAGTNGKGSAAAYISTVLTAAGYRVGRYTSPAVMDYREKFQIDGKMISKQALCKYLEIVRTAVFKLTKEGLPHPTLFEIETAVSFLYFLDKKCDIAVIETGMGGKYDATNIIESVVCTVITSVSMDHMAMLGSSLEEIAGHKAGIIKDGVCVVSAMQKNEVMKVIEDSAAQKGCRLIIADVKKAGRIKYKLTKQSFNYGKYKNLEITMSGKYQIENAVLALEAIEAIGEAGFTVSEDELREGLAKTYWNGRFSVIGRNPLFIADGAHNEDAALKLAESVSFYFTNRRIIYIMGVLEDKEYDKIIKATYSLAEHIITVTPPDNTRALSGYELAQTARLYHDSVTVADSLQEAVELAYLLAGKDKDAVIVSFGSLSFMGKLIHIVEIRDTFRRDSHGKSEEN